MRRHPYYNPYPSDFDRRDMEQFDKRWIFAFFIMSTNDYRHVHTNTSIFAGLITRPAQVLIAMTTTTRMPLRKPLRPLVRGHDPGTAGNSPRRKRRRRATVAVGSGMIVVTIVVKTDMRKDMNASEKNVTKMREMSKRKEEKRNLKGI